MKKVLTLFLFCLSSCSCEDQFIKPMSPIELIHAYPPPSLMTPVFIVTDPSLADKYRELIRTESLTDEEESAVTLFLDQAREIVKQVRNPQEEERVVRFTKNSVVVEAFQMTSDLFQFVIYTEQDYLKWFQESVQRNIAVLDASEEKWGVLKTKKGGQKAIIYWNDWVVKEANGELKVVKPEIFDKEYQELRS